MLAELARRAGFDVEDASGAIRQRRDAGAGSESLNLEIGSGTRVHERGTAGTRERDFSAGGCDCHRITGSGD